MTNKNNQPAHEIRKGSVKATIWLNESAKGANYQGRRKLWVIGDDLVV